MFIHLFLLILFIPQFQSLKVIQTSYGKLRGITVWSNDKNHRYMFKVSWVIQSVSYKWRIF